MPFYHLRTRNRQNLMQRMTWEPFWLATSLLLNFASRLEQPEALYY